jgi:hypothetical protein
VEQVTLYAQLSVIPADGPEGDRKTLVFSDPDTGRTILYPMEKDLIEQTLRKLRMSNKALINELKETAARAQAAAALDINGGSGGMPGAEQVVRDILAGEKDPRRTA